MSALGGVQPPSFSPYPVSGFWSWDIRNNRVFGDANLAEYYSVDVEKAVTGLPMEYYLNAVLMEDRKRVEDAVRRAVQLCGSCNQVYRVRTANRGVRKIMTRGICQGDADGKATYYPGWFVDVTDGDMTPDAALNLAASHILHAKSVAALSNRTLVAYMLEAVLQQIDDERLTRTSPDPT